MTLYPTRKDKHLVFCNAPRKGTEGSKLKCLVMLNVLSVDVAKR